MLHVCIVYNNIIMSFWGFQYITIIIIIYYDVHADVDVRENLYFTAAAVL